MALVAPYLTLLTPCGRQRRHDLRAVFNALRWMVQNGSPWRYLPAHRKPDFPRWEAVSQQAQRWIACVDQGYSRDDTAEQSRKHGIELFGETSLFFKRAPGSLTVFTCIQPILQQLLELRNANDVRIDTDRVISFCTMCFVRCGGNFCISLEIRNLREQLECFNN